MKTFFYLFKRECILLSRKPMQLLLPLLFFLLVCILFPLAISSEKQLLQQLAPGIMWVAVLLAHLLSLPHLFAEDHEDGSLDQWIVQPAALPSIIISRVITQWLFFIFPMIVLAPVLSVMYHLSFFTAKILIVSLLLGTPLIVMQGAMVASLCVGLKRNGLLLAIILLPMYIPTMILGTTVVTAAQEGLPVLFQLDVLGALLILAMTFGPSVIAFALRVGITYG